MKVNPTYRSLLDKSVGSMLSAIEIYNKPNFQYREETFSILAVNAWELLLKAYILKINKFKLQSIYCLQPAKLKNGKEAKKRKVPIINRCNNPCTISIFEALKVLNENDALPFNLKENIESLIELRDNAVHFYNTQSIEKPVQELGFACIKNYMGIIKKWDLPIDLSKYNFYLMPLAYVDEKKFVQGELTREVNNYIQLIKDKIKKENDDDDFNIAVTIDLDFKKGNSFDAIGVKYDKNGTEIILKEEDIRKKYPLTYRDIVEKCTTRYSNFKKNKEFNKIMNEQIKGDEKLCKKRLLDPSNPKTQAKAFYNGNVFKVLDNFYNKVK